MTLLPSIPTAEKQQGCGDREGIIGDSSKQKPADLNEVYLVFRKVQLMCE